MAVHPDIFEPHAVSQSELDQVGGSDRIAVLTGRHRAAIQNVNTEYIVADAQALSLVVRRDQHIQR